MNAGQNFCFFSSASTRKIFCDPTFSKNTKRTNNFFPSDSIVYICWLQPNYLQFCNSANLERFFATSNLCLVSFFANPAFIQQLKNFSCWFSEGDCPPLPIIPLHNKKVRISSFSSILCSVPPVSLFRWSTGMDILPLNPTNTPPRLPGRTLFCTKRALGPYHSRFFCWESDPYSVVAHPLPRSAKGCLIPVTLGIAPTLVLPAPSLFSPQNIVIISWIRRYSSHTLGI